MSDRMPQRAEQRADQRAPQRPPPRAKLFNPATIFEYDETKRPQGMAYQWVVLTVGGMERPEHLIIAEQNGWTPVPAERHPELSGLRAQKGAAIVRGGQMLMEQPVEYRKEAEDADKFAARHAVESQIARLGLQSRRDGVKQPFRKSMEQIGEAVE